MIHAITAYLGDIALFWPGVLATGVLSLGLSTSLARRLGSSRWIAALLIFGIGLIVSATLTPSREAIRFGALGSGTCDLSRFGLPSLADLADLDPVFNVALFVPLGVAIALLPGGRLRRLLVAVGFALPVLIELTQLEVVRLGRACQSGDAVDNITGFVAGIALAWLAVRLGRQRSPAADDR